MHPAPAMEGSYYPQFSQSPMNPSPYQAPAPSYGRPPPPGKLPSAQQLQQDMDFDPINPFGSPAPVQQLPPIGSKPPPLQQDAVQRFQVEEDDTVSRVSKKKKKVKKMKKKMVVVEEENPDDDFNF